MTLPQPLNRLLKLAPSIHASLISSPSHSLRTGSARNLLLNEINLIPLPETDETL